MSTGAVSRTVVGIEVLVSGGRGNLCQEATGEGTGQEITMPRGFEHRSPLARLDGEPQTRSEMSAAKRGPDAVWF